MIHWPAALAGCAILIAAGLVVSAPADLRPRQWLRIILSAPFVIIIADAFASPLSRLGGSAAFVSMFALALIWKSVAAHYGAGGFVRLITGDMNARTGVRADFSTAKQFQKHGDLAEAIQHTQWELEKEAASYEGLMLLADLREQEGSPKRAAGALEQLLRRGRLTREQRAIVETRWRTLNGRLVTKELNRR